MHRGVPQAGIRAPGHCLDDRLPMSETQWRVIIRYRLPLRGQHRHRTCFPFNPSENPGTCGERTLRTRSSGVNHEEC